MNTKRQAERHGGLTRAVPSQVVGRCGNVKHAAYGAMCLGCVIDLCREERLFEREACAKMAEQGGLVGQHIAKKLRGLEQRKL